MIGAEAKVSGNASGLTVAGAKTRCCWKDLSLIGRLQCVVLDCPDVWDVLVHNHLDRLPLAMSGLCRSTMLTTIRG